MLHRAACSLRASIILCTIISQSAVQSIVQAEHLDKLAPLRNSLPSTARKAEQQAPSSPQAASRAAFAALAKQGSGSRSGKAAELPCSPAASDLIEVSGAPSNACIWQPACAFDSSGPRSKLQRRTYKAHWAKVQPPRAAQTMRHAISSQWHC